MLDKLDHDQLVDLALSFIGALGINGCKEVLSAVDEYIKAHPEIKK